MNQGFKLWIIHRYERMEPSQLKGFLTKLKLSPEEVRQIIFGRLANWAAEYMSDYGLEIAIDFRFDPDEVLQALQEYFPAELAGVPG